MTSVWMRSGSIGVLLSLVTVIGAAEDDFKKFTDAFGTIAGTLAKMKQLKESDPDYRENPFVDYLVDQGGAGTVLLYNIFMRVNDLVEVFNPRSGDKSLLVIAQKLDAAGRCLQTSTDKKKQDACLADAIELSYQLIKPFISTFIGDVHQGPNDSKPMFYEGALLHMSHLNKMLPPQLLAKNPKLAEAIKKYEEARDGMVIPFVQNSVFPVFDLMKQLSVSIKMLSQTATEAERRALVDIPPLEIEGFDQAVKNVDWKDADILAED